MIENSFLIHFIGFIFILGGFNDEECTSNAYSGCKRTGSVAHPINPIQSARLRSKRGFSFKYGKVEVEAKMSKGDWIWPGKYDADYRRYIIIRWRLTKSFFFTILFSVLWIQHMAHGHLHVKTSLQILTKFNQKDKQNLR